MKYPFVKEPGSGLILITVQLDGYEELKMVIDTAASITTIDINVLRMIYYPIGDIIETGQVETANGIVEVDIIQTKAISAFGHTVRDMKVQMYDFLKRGVISDYDGVLGLDFFKNTEFTIDMVNQTIEVKNLYHEQVSGGVMLNSK